MHYLTVQSLKSAAVLIEDGAFARFFGPAAGIWQLKCPCPHEIAMQGKKKMLITLKGALVHLELIEAVEPWDNQPL